MSSDADFCTDGKARVRAFHRLKNQRLRTSPSKVMTISKFDKIHKIYQKILKFTKIHKIHEKVSATTPRLLYIWIYLSVRLRAGLARTLTRMCTIASLHVQVVSFHWESTLYHAFTCHMHRFSSVLPHTAKPIVDECDCFF